MVRFALVVAGAVGLGLSAFMRAHRARSWHRTRLDEATADRALRAGAGARTERVRVEGDADWVRLGIYSLDKSSTPDPDPTVHLTADVTVVRADGRRFVMPARADLALFRVAAIRQTNPEYVTDFAVDVPNGVELSLVAMWPEPESETFRTSPAAPTLGVPPVAPPWCASFIAGDADPMTTYLEGVMPTRRSRQSWSFAVGAPIVLALAVWPMSNLWGSVLAVVVLAIAALVEWLAWQDVR